MRAAAERRRRVGRIVHLDEVDIHEKWLVALRMLFDVVDRGIGLPDVEFSQAVVSDRANERSGSAGGALPFPQVYDVVIHLVVFRIVRRKPWVEPFARVVVGVNTSIISGEMFHLIEAMLDGIGVGLVTEMPLAREVGRVTVLLEEFRNRRRLFP